jgi:hypothetical protein
MGAPSVECLNLRLWGCQRVSSRFGSTKSRPAGSLLSGLFGSFARAVLVHVVTTEQDPQCLCTLRAACHRQRPWCRSCWPQGTDQLGKRLAIGLGYTIISVLSFSRQCAVSRRDRRVCDSLRLPFRTRTSLRRATILPLLPMGFLSDGSIANLCSRWRRTRTPHDREKEECVRVSALAR